MAPSTLEFSGCPKGTKEGGGVKTGDDGRPSDPEKRVGWLSVSVVITGEGSRGAGVVF